MKWKEIKLNKNEIKKNQQLRELILASNCPVQHPPQLVHTLNVNRDKQEAHLSLPHLNTKKLQRLRRRLTGS